MKIILITGGVRSGKSSYALELAEQVDRKRAFIATAAPIDSEMKIRIENHQKERADRYDTFEEQVDLITQILEISEDYEVVVVDCLTVWLGNLYYKNNDNEEFVQKEVDRFIEFLNSYNGKMDIIFVTNEVGSGIIPNNALSRSYRDLAGYLNRSVATIAESLYFSVCGIAQKIK